VALPILDATWEWHWNTAVAFSGSALTDHRAVMLAIKNQLIGLAGMPWSVVGSSNGVAGALDAVDRWAAGGDLLWNTPGNAHSWIVLQADGIPNLGGAGQCQLCIDLNARDAGVSGPLISVIWNAGAAFAGGTNLARPTSADEIVVLNAAQWLGTSSASPSFDAKIHVLATDDGVATRVIVYIATVPVLFWSFEAPLNAPAGWPEPNVCHVLGATDPADEVTTYAKLHHAAAGDAFVNGTPATVYMGTDGWNGQALGERLTGGAGDITAEWPITPVFYASETVGAADRLSGHTAGARGSWDLWMGADSLGQPVDYYPSGGAKTFVQIGCLIFPNDGTVVQVS
jgi:hypothetical protein